MIWRIFPFAVSCVFLMASIVVISLRWQRCCHRQRGISCRVLPLKHSHRGVGIHRRQQAFLVLPPSMRLLLLQMYLLVIVGRRACCDDGHRGCGLLLLYARFSFQSPPAPYSSSSSRLHSPPPPPQSPTFSWSLLLSYLDTSLHHSPSLSLLRLPPISSSSFSTSSPPILSSNLDIDMKPP